MHDPTFDIPEENYPPCKLCDGTGLIDWYKFWSMKRKVKGINIGDKVKCPHCDGKGYIEPEETDEIPY